MKHSPLPWTAEGVPPNMVLTFAKGEVGNRMTPCILLADEDQQSNADFIVRAVNSHDELVKFVEETFEYFDAGDFLYEKARALLAKVAPPQRMEG